MVLVRGLLAVAMIVLGVIIIVRMLEAIRAGLAILPGVVLGAAMIALGAHRLSLIFRLRGTT
jgi:hypothetical protein